MDRIGMAGRRWTASVGWIIVSLALAACASPGAAPEQTPGGEPAAGDGPQEQQPEAATPLPPQEVVICTGQALEVLAGVDGIPGEALLPLVTLRAAVFGTGYVAGTDLLAALPATADGSLRRNDDGTLTVTLRYRDDLVWSDGQPFSAQDALLGLSLPAPRYAPAFDVIEAQVLDDHTLRVLAAEDARYPYVPAQPPLPAHVLGAHADPEALAARNPLDLHRPALGPYQPAGTDPAGGLRFEANPYYPGSAALISQVTVRPLPDPAAPAAALSAEGCDLVLDEGLPFEHLASLQAAESSGAARLYAWPAAVYDQVIFNTYTADSGRIPYFADVRTRQALAQALNRAALAESLWGGVTPVLDGWLPADHWASAGASLTAYPFDSGAAGALLDAAGWRDQDGDGIRDYAGTGGSYTCQRGEWAIAAGTPLAPVVLIPEGDALREQIAARLVDDLAAVGIRVQVQPVAPDTLFSPEGPLVRRQFDLALLAASASPDPAGVSRWAGAEVFRHPQTLAYAHRWELEERWLRPEQMVERMVYDNTPSAGNGWQGQNYAGWCSETAHFALMEAAVDGLEIAGRGPAYAAHQAIFSAELPVLPLFSRARLAAGRPALCGIEPGPVDPLTWNAAAWWFDESGACRR